TGIKSECIFNELKSFHVVENVHLDIMHDLDEGVWKQTMTCVINILIQRKRFDIDTLNNSIQGFYYTTWSTILEQREDIEEFVQSTSQITWEIHDLIVEIVKIRNENVVKFTSRDTFIYMKPSTVLSMLDLKH
ncbi:hypothetical protein ALC60_11174, partial [Trachymyrmex zeteki]